MFSIWTFVTSVPSLHVTESKGFLCALLPFLRALLVETNDVFTIFKIQNGETALGNESSVFPLPPCRPLPSPSFSS